MVSVWLLRLVPTILAAAVGDTNDSYIRYRGLDNTVTELTKRKGDGQKWCLMAIHMATRYLHDIKPDIIFNAT